MKHAPSACLALLVLSAQAANVSAPRFEVDFTWPKPLPNHWILGQTIGVSVDAQDHVWIIHRAGSLEARRGARRPTNPPTAQCCAPAPPVLEFDQAGNLIGHWGGPGDGYDWPDSNHGITVDYKGNVWIGGNGRGKPRLPRRATRRNEERRRAAVAAAFNDNMVLKFTQDGKFLMQIGKPRQSKGSNDIENLRLPGQDLRRPEDQRTVRRRRLRQPSRDRVRRRYRQVQAPLGRLRPQAGRCRPGRVQPERVRRRSSSAIRCIAPSSRTIGLLYVCDRVNDRIQVFKPDGTFVKEVFIEKNTLGSGSVWDIAFSKDPQQKYIYLADGENDKVHILDRESLEVLTSFGEGGRQPGEFYGVHSIATDSKGNIYTTETYRGQRVQKFVYKGLAPVTKKDQGVVWPKAGR